MNRRKNCGIKKRFHGQSTSDRDLARWDVTSGTAFQESFLECQIAFRDCNKKTVIQFQKIRHDLTQDKIFVDALDRRLLIRYTVTATRMQQTMVTPGRTECDFPAFDQSDV